MNLIYRWKSQHFQQLSIKFLGLLCSIGACLSNPLSVLIHLRQEKVYLLVAPWKLSRFPQMNAS